MSHFILRPNASEVWICYYGAKFKLFTGDLPCIITTQDARKLIHFSGDSLQKARLLAESSESTLRIGTSLLYKCRMLPDLCPKVNEIQPDLKIEIRLMKEYENRQTVFSRLGIYFDLFEGIYAKEPTAATEKFMQAETRGSHNCRWS